MFLCPLFFSFFSIKHYYYYYWVRPNSAQQCHVNKMTDDAEFNLCVYFTMNVRQIIDMNKNLSVNYKREREGGGRREVDKQSTQNVYNRHYNIVTYHYATSRLFVCLFGV